MVVPRTSDEAARERRFRKQRSSARQNASPTSVFTAMALGPGMVLAEEAGSAFCPLSPSRRLRLFAPPALPVSHAAQRSDGPCSTAKQGCWSEPSRAMRRIPWPKTASLAGGRLRGGRRGSHCVRGPARRSAQREGGSQGDRCGFPHRRAGSRKQSCFAV